MEEGTRACTLRVRAGGNVLPVLLGNGGTRAAVPTAGDPTQQRRQVSGRLAVTFSFTAKQYICSYMFLFISMF